MGRLAGESLQGRLGEGRTLEPRHKTTPTLKKTVGVVGCLTSSDDYSMGKPSRTGCITRMNTAILSVAQVANSSLMSAFCLST